MGNTYGKRIKRDREKIHMTREELADLMFMEPEELALVEEGKNVPLMSLWEVKNMLEEIPDKIAVLEKMQEMLGEQIYDEKAKDAGAEISLAERYTMAMELAGYEPVQTEPDSMATVTFKNKNSGRTAAFDGWQSVGYYLEDASPTDEVQAKRFDELIHPRGRIQAVTQNLDEEISADGNRIRAYPDMEAALNAYLDTGIMDPKAIGFRMAGQDPSSPAVWFAHFDTVDMENHIHDMSQIRQFIPDAAVNELEQIESMQKAVSDELQKENAYIKIQDTFNDISMMARRDIVRQNSEWGSWFGVVANNRRPQDYVKIDITGYSVHHEVVYTVDVLHADEVVDSRTFTAATDENHLADTMEKAYITSYREFAEFFKGAVEKLDTDLEYPMIEYTPYTVNSMEEHRVRLEAFHDFAEEAEEEILQEREIKM